MKKLGKLTINPEKVIKNEELVNLRGGYGNTGTGCCDCSNCTVSPGYFIIVGSSSTECLSDCRAAFGCVRGSWSCS